MLHHTCTLYYLQTTGPTFIPDISIAPLQVHYYSEAFATTALILCRSQCTEALQATAREGHAQDSYVADRVGFKPETLWTQGTEPTTESPCPHKR